MFFVLILPGKPNSFDLHYVPLFSKAEIFMLRLSNALLLALVRNSASHLMNFVLFRYAKDTIIKMFRLVGG